MITLYHVIVAVIIRAVVRRGWRGAVAGGGGLVLAGCVLLLGVLLKVKGLQEAARVAGVLSVVLALPALAIPLVLWWRRGSVATAPSADQVSQARETLAGLVSAQWRHEALARSLGDPQPMPVQWRLTERAVMDYPRFVEADQWSFTGRSNRIGPLAEEFRGLQRRRLVILGGPGSGKTTLTVQLLLELLATRQHGEPIPVLLSLAGWDPTIHPQLYGWLAERLAEDYPSLRAFGPGVPRALGEQGQILPILDGLDELPPARQPEVITALNASLTETDQFVLTSRSVEFATAIAEAQKALTAAAVVEPEPLTADEAAEYLQACLPLAPDPGWRDVLDRLRAGTAEYLATVVATPLGLWLLRTVYITRRADPRPLLASEVTRDAATLKAHLLDQLIPTVLATRPASRDANAIFRPRRTWDSTEVRSWLTYLAHHLDRIGTRDLLWWHLARHTFTPRAFSSGVGLGSGLGSGLIVGLGSGLVGGPVVGLAVGLVVGLAVGLVIGQRGQHWLTDEPAYANLQLKHRTGMLIRDLEIGLTVGLTGGLVVSLVVSLVVWLAFGLMVGLAYGLVAGLAYGLAWGLVLGLTKWVGTPSRTGWASTPSSTYKATRALTIIQVCVSGLGIGLGVGLAASFALGLEVRLKLGLEVGVASALLAGLASALVVGLVSARVVGLTLMSSHAWISYIVTSCQLAAAGKLPLRIMDFLDDAYRLGLLRTTGPAFQFRHAEFHDHLIRTSSSQVEDQAEPSTRSGE